MWKYVFFISFLSVSLNASANGNQNECFRYAYLKSSMSQSSARSSCKKIDNKFALACSKLAIAYLHQSNQVDLVKSCAKIKTEKALTCVIQKALQARSEHAKKISRCS